MSKEAKPRQANSLEQNIATAPAQAIGGLKLEPAAQYLGGLSVPAMHRLIQRGLLHPNGALRHLLFPVAELDRFLRDSVSK